MNNTTKYNTIKNEDYEGVSTSDGPINKRRFSEPLLDLAINEQYEGTYVPDVDVRPFRRLKTIRFKTYSTQFEEAHCQMGELEDRVSATAVVTSKMEEGTPDAQQTTTFVNDAVVAKVETFAPARLPALYAMSSDQVNSDNIKAFLGKPYMIDHGTLAAGDNYASYAPGYDLPGDLLALPMYKNKLDGYLGVRFTMKIRFVINGNPFQRGRYMLYYVPYAGATISSKRVAWLKAHSNTRYERSQLKRIELDVACDTEGTMTIPFSSVMNFYPIHGTPDGLKLGSLGHAQIAPYVSVATASGSAYVNFSVYVSFEDVELVGAAVPQMGKAPSAIDREQRAEGKGPVSSTVFAFSKAAGAIADIPIPIISDFAGTVSWALGVAGNTAKALGFAKPSDVGAPCTMQSKGAKYMGVTDGFDNSVSLGAFSDNQVVQLPNGSETDEMALITIATIPSWFQTVPWTDARANGYQLAAWDLAPINYRQVRSMNGTAVYNSSPISFVAQFFTAYRGSFVFKLKIVKTIFHSGRFAICFFPYSPLMSSGASYSFANSEYVHREIIDVRTASDIEFTVPYVCQDSYLPINRQYGTVVLYVIDPLVAPATVTSAIDIIAEVRAGPDFEFARPASYPDNPFTLGGSFFNNATPQMGEPEDACSLISTTIGSTEPVSYSGTINAEICMGEKVVSFRSLLKSFKLQRFRVDTGTSTNCVSIVPSGINTFYWDGGTTNLLGSCYGDLYDLLGGCFMTSRGSMRVKFAALPLGYYVANTYEVFNVGTEIAARQSDAVIGLNPAFTNFYRNGRIICNSSRQDPIVEIQVPQYTTRHSRNNISEMCCGIAGYTYSSDGELGSGVATSLNSVLASPLGNSPNFFCLVYRAVGDDFSFSNFVSTIPYQKIDGGAC